MGNIHHQEFKDTEIKSFTVGTHDQVADEFGVIKIALKPDKYQFHGKITIGGCNPHYNGTYDVSGNNLILPYQSANPHTEIDVTLEPGQNIRRFSGVILVDDQQG